MSFLARLLREFAKRRHSIVILFCLTALTILLFSSLMPRTWTAVATLEFRPDTNGGSELARQVQQRSRAIVLGPDDHLETVLAGHLLELRLQSTTPDRAFEQIRLLVSRIAREERERRRQSLVDLASRLERESEAASRVLSDSIARLEAHRLAMREGGGDALAGRIAELSAQAETQSLVLRDKSDQKASLLRQRRGLEDRAAALQSELDAPRSVEARIAGLRAQLADIRTRDGAAFKEEVERELSGLEVERQALADRRNRAEQMLATQVRPGLAAIVAQLDAVGMELNAAEFSRQRVLSAIGVLQSELDDQHRGNRPLQDLERRFADAEAEYQRIGEALQGVRDDSVASASVNEPPFALLHTPTLPRRPDGWSPWTIVALALVSAGCVMCVYGLVAFLLSGSRSAEALSVPDMASGNSPVDPSGGLNTPVRPAAVLAAVLCVLTAAAVGFFVVLAG